MTPVMVPVDNLINFCKGVEMKKLLAAVFATMFGLCAVSAFAADEMKKDDTKMEKTTPKKATKAKAPKKAAKKGDMKNDEMKK
jgi:hypothetical protein